jgi:hypothetical protein
MSRDLEANDGSADDADIADTIREGIIIHIIYNLI